MEETYVVGTGYGRARLPFSKEHVRSEILCHGLGAHVMYPGTATVLDIGGQDTKAIQVDPAGIVESFQMNDRCAAGCGRYLGYIADEMNMGLHELGPMAMKSTKTIRINSTCTVFAGAELRDRLSLGDKREDIMAGLHRAIILRAMSILARSGGIRDQFTFTGGVAKNEAAVKALKDLVNENYGELQLNIDPDSIYTGALGGATFAWRAVVEEGKTAEARVTDHDYHHWHRRRLGSRQEHPVPGGGRQDRVAGQALRAHPAARPDDAGAGRPRRRARRRRPRRRTTSTTSRPPAKART